MEYSAQTLAQRIGELPGDPAEVLRMMLHVGMGLRAMHSLKPALLHQDIKPANILVDQSGNYKVTDFSLATVTAAHKTHGLATVRYAAPELLSSEFGRVGPATDLYALGHMAYEMALGSKLHRAQFPAVFEGNANKEPPPNKWMMWHASIGMNPAPASTAAREFPEALAEVIARLMAKQPAQRYASAEEMLGDLAALRHEQYEVPLAAAGSTPARPSAEPLPLEVAPETPAVKKPAHPAAASRSSAAAYPGMKYWVRLRGKVAGPFDLLTLQRQLKQGQLSRLHEVSTDQTTWKRATDVDGLFGPSLV
jgi:serine/threonine protein kinase